MELYIHIPFCVRKCEYCSFVSFTAGEEEKDIYISSLLREAEIRKEEIQSSVSTIYIGGGTPSLLTSDQFTRLTGGIRNIFSIIKDAEFSVEANPGTLTESFLDVAVSAGVNRLSVGMQAAQTDILKFLGRIHTFEQVEKSVALARHAGIRNLNLDLIFGIPGQTPEEWEETLDAALSLSPDHISAYGLIPEEGTPLFRKLEEKKIFLPDPETERFMYDLAIKKFHNAGIEQYEISNFAKKGFECKHNIGYWTHVPYIGLGLSSASMRISEHNNQGTCCIRRTNPSDPVLYNKMICSESGAGFSEETVGPAETRFETIMLGLRMNKGIGESDFLKMHGVSMHSCYGPVLESMREKGLMKHENGTWSLTRKGMDIQNTILIEFMNDLL